MKLSFLSLSLFCFVLALAAAGGSGLALQSADVAPPGIGLIGIALFDLFLVYAYATLLLQILGLGGLAGRLQWLTALAVGIVIAVLGLLGVLAALQLLSIMVALLLSVPFGTAVYMAVYGSFDTDTVRGIVAIVVVLKLLGFALLVLAVPGVLKNVQLAALTALSLLFTCGLELVYAFVPGFLASIADAVAAIVFGAFALLWGLILALGGAVSLVRAIRGLAPV